MRKAQKIKEYINIFQPLVKEVLDAIPSHQLLEGMIRRDNYFHNCWMKLKMERSDLWDEMSKIELFISGYNPDEKDEPKKEKPNPLEVPIVL